MALARAYRVLAKSTSGDTHLIVTEDRGQALRYWTLFQESPNLFDPRIELGAQTFTSAIMDRLP